jgi:hypothetical protein
VGIEAAVSPRLPSVVRSQNVPVAGIVRADRGCGGPRVIPSPGVQRPFGIDYRGGEPARAAIMIECSPSACCLVPVLSHPRHGLQAFPSLCGAARRKRAKSPRAFTNSEGRRHRTGGVTPLDVRRWPRGQTVTPAPRLVALVAPSVAFELALSILAAGPARN